MKKIKKRIILLFAALIGTMCTAASCSAFSSGENYSPKDVIADKYGSEEFRISFNSEGLSQPLEDLYYTASSMPSFPTPERIGYVFKGWYYDKELTIPYTENSLLLYMKDVTFYAKWEEESMSQNGIYDIDVSYLVVEDSLSPVTKNDTKAAYDFLDDIYTKETRIEKSGNTLQLRFSFDNRTYTTFNGAETYTVTVSRKTAGSVVVGDSVKSLSETKRTLYINLNNFSLSDTLYLDVIAYDWDRAGATSSQIAKTRVDFEVALNITRFIGFTSAFADTSVPLEEGYYQVKTFFRGATYDDETMMSQYNPVYSYIYAYKNSNGEINYKLIKPFVPYVNVSGDGGTQAERIKLYGNRLTTFVSIFAYYDIFPNADKTSFTEGSFGALTTEFHADTGKNYYIFDLGNSLKKDIMLVMSVSGAMEVLFHGGMSKTIMTIDYEHITRLDTCDYTPLSGDAYEFSDKYSIGFSADNDEKYALMSEYGLSASYAHYYYTPALGSTEKTMYSHKIVCAPIGAASASGAKTVAYTRCTDIYDYDGEQSLYADAMSVSALSSYSYTSLRNSYQVKTGKSITQGDRVNLKDVFLEKVNPDTDFSSVSYKAYEIKSGKIDYSVAVSVGESFIFSKDIAVVYTVKDSGGKALAHCIVELRTAYTPMVSFAGNGEIYTPGDFRYRFGDTIFYPALEYEWFGKRDSFLGVYYPMGDDDEEETIQMRPNALAAFSVSEDGSYTYVNLSVADKDLENLAFDLNYSELLLVYELKNDYGESYFYTITFKTTDNEKYQFTFGDDVLKEGDVTYNSDGTIKKITVKEKDAYTVQIADYTALSVLLSKEMILKIGSESILLLPESATIASDTATFGRNNTFTSEDGDLAELIKTAMKDSSRGMFSVVYSNGYHSYTASYSYGLNFDGATTFAPVKNEIFTGTSYALSLPRVYDNQGRLISAGTYSIGRVGGGADYTGVKSNQTYNVVFNKPGEYVLICTVNTTYDSENEVLFSSGRRSQFRFAQTFTVKSDSGKGKITFVASEEHPFKDKTITSSLTMEYGLRESFSLLQTGSFESNGKTLIGWAVNPKTTFDIGYIYYTNVKITSMIQSFGTDEITLYPIWDEGITVTIDCDEEHTGITPKSRSYNLEDNGTSYRVYYSDFAIPAKSADGKYVLIGFTGGALGSQFIEVSSIHDYTTFSAYGDTTITAVYKQVLTVKFKINSEYSSSVIANATVLYEESLNETYTAAKAEIKEKYKTTYRFVGWYVEGDETQTLIDLSTYKFTADTTLVAKFEKVAEE